MSPQGLMLVLRVLLALALYSFLAAAIWTVWKSVPRQSRSDLHIPEMYAIEYHDDHMVHGHRLKAINLIGRAAGNTIVLPDERISAHHGRITYTGGQWLLEDLGSRNGTYVNEMPLDGPLVVTIEDRIQVGSIILELAEKVPLDKETFTF